MAAGEKKPSDESEDAPPASKLNFSSRGLPRDEIAEEDPAPPKPAASTAAAAPASAAPSATPVTPEPSTALSWLTGLFSRR
jgi:hypothetical protein